MREMKKLGGKFFPSCRISCLHLKHKLFSEYSYEGNFDTVSSDAGSLAAPSTNVEIDRRPRKLRNIIEIAIGSNDFAVTVICQSFRSVQPTGNERK